VMIMICLTAEISCPFFCPSILGALVCLWL